MAFYEYDLQDAFLQFETPDDLHTFAHNEHNFWASQKENGRYGNSVASLLKRQQQFTVELIKFVDIACAAPDRITRPGGSPERDTLNRIFGRMMPDRDDRILCTKLPDDLFAIDMSDEYLKLAGMFLRSRTEESRDFQRMPDFRDAQLRFILLLTEDRGRRMDSSIKNMMETARINYLQVIASDGLVDHWEKRAIAARQETRTALRKFGIACAAVIMLVMAAVIFALQEKLVVIGQPETLLGITPIAVILGIPLIWLLRHFSRLFVDAQNDARDAELRHVMAKAYVAMLTNTGQHPQPQERAIILAALFRAGASQSGDEGVPLPLIELLRKG